MTLNFLVNLYFLLSVAFINQNRLLSWNHFNFFNQTITFIDNYVLSFAELQIEDLVIKKSFPNAPVNLKINHRWIVFFYIDQIWLSLDIRLSVLPFSHQNLLIFFGFSSRSEDMVRQRTCFILGHLWWICNILHFNLVKIWSI